MPSPCCLLLHSSASFSEILLSVLLSFIFRLGTFRFDFFFLPLRGKKGGVRDGASTARRVPSRKKSPGLLFTTCSTRNRRAPRFSRRKDAEVEEESETPGGHPQTSQSSSSAAVAAAAAAINAAPTKISIIFLSHVTLITYYKTAHTLSSK